MNEKQFSILLPLVCGSLLVNVLYTHVLLVFPFPMKHVKRTATLN